MPGSNDFLPFGTSGTAAVQTQAQYVASTPANGYGPGLLPKEPLNKVLRQSSSIAAMIGTYIANAGFVAADNGNIPALTTAFVNALAVQIAAAIVNVVPAPPLIDSGTNLTAVPIGGVLAGQTHGASIGATAVLGTFAFTASNYITTLDASNSVFTNIQYGTWRFLGSVNATYGIWLRTA